MKINFGNYTYFDPNSKDLGIYSGNDNAYKDKAFNGDYFNKLIANRQYSDAADYAAQYHFTDPATQKAHESDIINLRRSSKILGAVYGRITDPEDLAKVTFADNVFVDGGLEQIADNQFKKKFEDYKAQIGSNIEYNSFGENIITNEAVSLGITFEPEKNTFLGIDWLAKDNDYNINNFYQTSGLTEEELRNAGVQVIHKDGRTTLRFNKSNKLANKILYNIPTTGASHRVGDLPVLELGGNTLPTVMGYDIDGNALSGGTGLKNFKNIIDDAQKTKEAYFDKVGRTYKDYSSTVGPMISDELYALKASLMNGEINETQYNRQARALAPNVFSAINSLGSGNYEMYTNNYNDSPTDETLIPADNNQRSELATLISNYDPKDIDVSAMVSNGKIGALITLEGSGNEEKSHKNDGKRIQIFVPGLLQEEAQAKINRDTSTRAVQELNSMIDWGYNYELRNGGEIGINERGEFIKGDLKLTKDEAIREINKDMIMTDCLSNLKFRYMNSDGEIINSEKYEEMSRLMAMNAAQDIYDDYIKLNINPQTLDVTLTDTYGNVYNPDDIFNRNIDRKTTQYEIYGVLQDIYSMYNELMNGLDYYK